MSLSDSAIFESFFERQNGGRAIHLLQENFRAFAPAPAQERENWLALLLEQGQLARTSSDSSQNWRVPFTNEQIRPASSDKWKAP